VRRAIPLILAAVVALAVPAVLVGNGLWLLTQGWYVHAEYARPGFPSDPYGLAGAQRTELALVGLRSIQPFNGRGVEVLRNARLPDGSAAFTEREIVHMADVRRVVGRVLLAHAIALAAALAAALALWRLGLRRLVAPGLLAGAGLTLTVAAALGVYMLATFDGFFVQFHRALFPGDSWLFRDSDTLIRLYPDAFWSDFGGVLAGLAVLQAAALAGASWWRLRRGRARAPEPAASGDPQPSA
jgi:integral membrane protein (TIGR01906 family)